MLADARAARLGRAYGTLARGSAFLAASLRARAGTGQDGLPGASGAKVVGNGLRELDRFLSLLLDEAAGTVCSPGFDQRDFARQNNVANKIGTFYGLAGLDRPDVRRLRAIGRVRVCLHHCRGVVHDFALWDDLSTAAGDLPGRPRLDPPERLAVTFEDLARICEFYAQSGAGLIAVCGGTDPVP